MLPALLFALSLFDGEIQPLLRKRCLACHNDQLRDGGLSLIDRESALAGGVHGPAIVPGKPDASLLAIAIEHRGDLKMPPGAKLSDREIATLRNWIAAGAPWGDAEFWRFDRLDRIGGHPVKVLGNPEVVDRAVQFGGTQDALFFDVHPLAGAETFTWEVLFRPDRGGAPEQRFFHLQERGSQNRLLFEIRVIGDQWCLDSFAMSSTGSKTLMNRSKLHPLGDWYHAAMVYDGREFRNYVNGELQNRAEVRLAPQGPGESSAGVRINLKDYFKGAIRWSRFTRRALTPEEFLE